MSKKISKIIELAIEGDYKPDEIADFDMEYPSQRFICDDGSVAITGEGGENLGIVDISRILLDPEFYKALGKKLGWGRKPYKTEIGKEYGKRICLHCGIDIGFQPPKESGCNHVHFPEACLVCSKNIKTWKEQWHELIDIIAEHGYENGVEKWAKEIIK